MEDKMKSNEITFLINEIYDSVEKSKVGKIMEMKGEQLYIHQIGFQTFITLLNNLVPKVALAEIKEPKEPWQE
jgi:hypothetical protein